MAEIQWQFILGHDMSSRAIAWFSAGHYSHVDVILDNGNAGWLLGARNDKIGLQPAGVAIRQPNYLIGWKRRTILRLPVGVEQHKAFFRFVGAQVGKPYDSAAIWGFALDRDWRARDSWMCSELQAAGLEEAGITPRLITPQNKITPVTLATVVSALGGEIVSDEWDQ